MVGNSTMHLNSCGGIADNMTLAGKILTLGRRLRCYTETQVRILLLLRSIVNLDVNCKPNDKASTRYFSRSSYIVSPCFPSSILVFVAGIILHCNFDIIVTLASRVTSVTVTLGHLPHSSVCSLTRRFALWVTTRVTAFYSTHRHRRFVCYASRQRNIHILLILPPQLQFSSSSSVQPLPQPLNTNNLQFE
jgi:hypothetical protein